MPRDIFVYCLHNGNHRKSYHGYTMGQTSPSHRLRQHRQCIQGGAKYTKTFDVCKLMMYIKGFPTKSVAMSYEWFSKRHTLHCHQDRLIFDCLHPRMTKFFAPLNHATFKNVKAELIIMVNAQYFEKSIADNLQTFYQIPVEFFTENESQTGVARPQCCKR